MEVTDDALSRRVHIARDLCALEERMERAAELGDVVIEDALEDVRRAITKSTVRISMERVKGALRAASTPVPVTTEHRP